MLIVLDLTDARVFLRHPDDFTRFSVAVEGAGGPDAVADLVRRSGLGRLTDDGEHVAVDLAALRALVGTAASAQWDEGLAGMIAYAATKGWVADDGGVLAHIEPRL